MLIFSKIYSEVFIEIWLYFGLKLSIFPSIKANDEAGDQSIVNRAVLYSDNYPVMFHLLFWTSLILGLAVVGIVCGMSSMDPGLDTVIYRMTSQRIKKDN